MSKVRLSHGLLHRRFELLDLSDGTDDVVSNEVQERILRLNPLPVYQVSIYVIYFKMKISVMCK